MQDLERQGRSNYKKQKDPNRQSTDCVKIKAGIRKKREKNTHTFVLSSGDYHVFFFESSSCSDSGT